MRMIRPVGQRREGHGRSRNRRCGTYAPGGPVIYMQPDAQAELRRLVVEIGEMLIHYVGADELPEGFADAVHKLAAAGPVSRKPLKARPRSRALDGAGLTGSYEEEQARVTCPAGRGCSGS